MAEVGSADSAVAGASFPASVDLHLPPDVDLVTLARALDASPELDTSVLACLSGRWPYGGLIGLHCIETADGAEHATGGSWIGWQAYDPDRSWWGRFDLLIQRREGRWLARAGSRAGADLPELAGHVRGAVEQCPKLPAVRIADLSSTDRAAHLAAVEEAVSAIRAGELYQVNVCARMHGELAGTPLDLFAHGVRAFAPDHAAFVRTTRDTVVSFSPELFLRRDGSTVRTSPIKGTRRRAVGPSADAADPAARELQHSVKDRAENIMIVDLMRNDLSRVSTTGGVRVSGLLTVRPAPGVWHLVSDVDADLPPRVTDTELLAASFPPGSVTGAPKSSAVRLISGLEDEPRGVFTGAIGFLSIDGGSCLNVAIRTFEIEQSGRFALGVGGGITAESVPSEEWRECLVKAAPLVGLGGVELSCAPDPAPECVDPSLGVFDAIVAADGRLPGLADHLGRLDRSTQELYGRQLPDDLAAEVQQAAEGRPGRTRLRIAVAPLPGTGELSVSIDVAPAADPPDTVALLSVTGRTGSWRHKWNDRRYLSSIEARIGEPAVALGLFVEGVGADAVVLETTRSNIAVVTAAGDVLTPVLDERVLPGVTRRRFLDAARDRGYRVRTGVVRVGDLLDSRLVLSLNATGIVAAGSLDGVALAGDQRLLAEIRGWFAVR